MYHDYHIRLDEKLWKRIVTEAKLRGYTIKKIIKRIILLKKNLNFLRTDIYLS